MFLILPNSYLDGNKIELTIVEMIEIDGLWVQKKGTKKSLSIVADKDYDVDSEQEKLKSFVISELKKMGYLEIANENQRWGID